jgi:hypothetical protein
LDNETRHYVGCLSGPEWYGSSAATGIQVDRWFRRGGRDLGRDIERDKGTLVEPEE